MDENRGQRVSLWLGPGVRSDHRRRAQPRPLWLLRSHVPNPTEQRATAGAVADADHSALVDAQLVHHLLEESRKVRRVAHLEIGLARTLRFLRRHQNVLRGHRLPCRQGREQASPGEVRCMKR